MLDAARDTLLQTYSCLQAYSWWLLTRLRPSARVPPTKWAAAPGFGPKPTGWEKQGAINESTATGCEAVPWGGSRGSSAPARRMRRDDRRKGPCSAQRKP